MTIKERLQMLEKNRQLNLDNYNSRKITQEQYYIRRRDVCNRISELKKNKN